IGATSTMSRSWGLASRRAARVSTTPSCSPSAPTTRTCGVRIRSLILGSTLMQHPSSLGVRPNKKCGARAAPPRRWCLFQPLGLCGPEVRSPRFCLVLYAVDGPERLTKVLGPDRINVTVASIVPAVDAVRSPMSEQDLTPDQLGQLRERVAPGPAGGGGAGR